MIASGSVLYFFDRAAAWGWGHPSIWVAAVVFPIAVLSFVRAEARTSDPLLPPGLFRSRRFAAPVSAEVMSICAGNGAFFTAPLLLTSVFDTNVVSTSFLMLPLPLGMAVGSPVGGRVAVRIGERAGGIIGAIAMTASMGLFLVGFLAESLPVFVGGLVIMGLAHGMMRPATASAAGNALQPEFFGVGMATMRMTAQLGGAAGISIAVTATALGGYGWFYAIGIGIAATSIVAVRFVLSQPHPATHAERVEAEERIEAENALTIAPAFEG
jgi:MFS family permease